MDEIQLREVEDRDLEHFFQHQQDAVACRQAAFTHPDPSDRAAFDAHWARIRAAATVETRTILANDRVAGHLASWFDDGHRQVTYWIGRDCWGRGIATAALRAFLAATPGRPVRARVAADNLASVRVLEKCGFVRLDADKGFAHARGCEIDEIVMHLA